MTNDNHQHTFSTPLKLRLVAYFRKEYGLDIKDEEADLFLRSLANVYDALAGSGRGAEGLGPRDPSPGARNTGGTFPNAT